MLDLYYLVRIFVLEFATFSLLKSEFVASLGKHFIDLVTNVRRGEFGLILEFGRSRRFLVARFSPL